MVFHNLVTGFENYLKSLRLYVAPGGRWEQPKCFSVPSYYQCSRSVQYMETWVVLTVFSLGFCCCCCSYLRKKRLVFSWSRGLLWAYMSVSLQSVLIVPPLSFVVFTAYMLTYYQFCFQKRSSQSYTVPDPSSCVDVLYWTM